MSDRQRYIGDGVTATVRDGVVTLSTERRCALSRMPSGPRETHFVVLEPDVWQALVRLMGEEQ